MRTGEADSAPLLFTKASIPSALPDPRTAPGRFGSHQGIATETAERRFGVRGEPGELSFGASFLHGWLWTFWLEKAMAQGLRQFAARPNWRPSTRILNGRGLRDASKQRPRLTWAVAVRGSTCGTPRRDRDGYFGLPVCCSA